MFRLAAALLLCASASLTHAQILIGQTTGVTGNSAANVEETSMGARLWIDAVNAKGGVNGQTIDLITLDDRGDAKLASANALALIEQKQVLALFMTRGTPQNEALLPLLERFGVPLIAPSTGAMVLHTPVKRYVFNVRNSYQAEAEKAVVQLASMGVTRIAVLKTRDSFGEDAATGALRGFSAAKLQPLFIEAFDKASPDFNTPAKRIASERAQAVLVLGTGASVVKATTEIRRAGSNATMVTLSNNASAGFVRDLGASARGVIVTQVFPSERAQAVPMIKEAIGLLRLKSPNSALSPAMVEGFAGAKVLVEALRRAGPHPSRAKLRDALEAMAHFDLGGLALHYSADSHSGVSFTDMSVIDNSGNFRR